MFDWCSNVLVGSPLFLQGVPHWKSSCVILLTTCAEFFAPIFYQTFCENEKVYLKYFAWKFAQFHPEKSTILLRVGSSFSQIVGKFNHILISMLANTSMLGLFLRKRLVLESSNSTEVPPACPPPCPARWPCPGASSSWPASRPGRPARRRWGPPSC